MYIFRNKIHESGKACTNEAVDEKLHAIMVNIYNNCKKASEDYGFGYNLVAGAMHQQGNY
ncbi:hypothetical protein [Clostridium thailandense]|uniref:hypothetical protein n=1 Tax=Clostridium thailandense TaxID=2794346 RepID=UPI00398A3C44